MSTPSTALTYPTVWAQMPPIAHRPRVHRFRDRSQNAWIPRREDRELSSRESGEFLPFSENAEDVDALSIDGQSVPFVVRLEIGTINRHIYVIAVLRGPNDTPDAPDLAFWNGKLVYQFRGGVGIGRRQGRIPLDYIPNRRQQQLRDGFAVAYSTANQTSDRTSGTQATNYGAM